MALLDFFNMKYPSTDFHELNLDWCISAILQMQKYMEEFTAGNKLIFADPLQHDLTKTYAKNTIVLDDDGNAYISLDTVPKGVQLSNAHYWLMVFNFEDYTAKANMNFTDNYLRNTTRAPQPYNVGDWLVLDDVLYKVIVAIVADDLFDIGTNIVHFTIEQFLKDFTTSIIQTVNQYKNDIDASELLYRQQLAQDIANTTASLQAQLDLAISGATVDSEVILARASWYGFTYPTLGDNVRNQAKRVSKYSGNIWNEEILYSNYYINASGQIAPAAGLFVSTKIPITPSTIYYCKCINGLKSAHIAQYQADDTFIGFLGYITDGAFTTAANASYLLFAYATSTYDPETDGISIQLNTSKYKKIYVPYITAKDYITDLEIEAAITNWYGRSFEHLSEAINDTIEEISECTDNMWKEYNIRHHVYLNSSGVPAAGAPGVNTFTSQDPIPVDPSTTYRVVNSDNTSNCHIAQYRSDDTFIGFLGYITNGTFTTDANASYILFTSNYGDDYEPDNNGIAIYPESSTHKTYLPYITAKDAVARLMASKLSDYIIIGTGEAYTTLKDGFNAAIAQDKGVILKPGVYDLGLEVGLPSIGLTTPKHLIGYGAKIVYHSLTEDWNFSPLNMSTSMDEVIIEGVEIEVEDCRYCIHDEEYNRANYYHHVIKNCKLTHLSAPTVTLIAPTCIGGGFGNSGLIEVENCVCSSEYTHDASYHANSTGQTGNCDWICKDSVFKTHAQLVGNALTGFLNTMYFSNCKCGDLPTDPGTANSNLVQWNIVT